MLSNMVTSLFLHERIVTSVAKAKELRPVAEKLITQAKQGKHQEVRRRVQNKKVAQKLFEVIAPRYQSRAGGYTQIIRIGVRAGDRSEQGMVRLVA